MSQLAKVDDIVIKPIFAADNRLIYCTDSKTDAAYKVVSFFEKFYNEMKSNKIIKCDDCRKWNLKENMEKIPACADSCEGDYGLCCYKYICPKYCTHKFQCVNCGYYNLQENEFSSYCRSHFKTNCFNCCTENIIELLWWGETCQEYKRKYGI